MAGGYLFFMTHSETGLKKCPQDEKKAKYLNVGRDRISNSRSHRIFFLLMASLNSGLLFSTFIKNLYFLTNTVDVNKLTWKRGTRNAHIPGYIIHIIKLGELFEQAPKNSNNL